jgi:uncharacterized membrane protein
MVGCRAHAYGSLIVYISLFFLNYIPMKLKVLMLKSKEKGEVFSITSDLGNKNENQETLL